MTFFFDIRCTFRELGVPHPDFSAALANSDFLLRRRPRVGGIRGVSLARHGRLLCSKIIRETETIDSAGLHSFVPFYE